MSAAFENYLRSQSRLSEEEIAYVTSLALPRTLRRNEAILSAGEVCRFKTYVLSGLLRTFSTSSDGSETILQFSPEMTWALDPESYDHQRPSQYHITAVEPSQVLLWSKADFNRLLSELPGLKNYAERLISRNIHSGRQRLLTALRATPEEKYEEFTRSFPDLLSRLPLRMIASYLGISLKTLTRIRHAQWTK